jgi:hypothetical protein
MSTYTKAQTLNLAISQMACYPQYTGYFDAWIEVRVCKHIKTKLGKAFVKDELSIARPEIRKVTGMDNVTRLFMTVWSVSNRCATSVEFKDVEILEAPVTLNFVKG